MKFAGAIVHEKMEATGAVDDGSIGIAVAIEVGPGKACHARNICKRLDGGEGAVSIVAQHLRHSLFCSHHDVQIAVGFDVHGPRAGVAGVEDGRRQFCEGAYVREGVRGYPAARSARRRRQRARSPS